MNPFEKRLLFGVCIFIAAMLMALLIISGIGFHYRLRQDVPKPLRNDRIEVSHCLST